MITTNSRLHLALGGVAAALLLGGCASERYQAQAKKEKEAIKSGDYVWYTPVGSNIPIKVAKDDPRVAKNEDNTEQTQNFFREAQRLGSKPESDNGGN